MPHTLPAQDHSRREFLQEAAAAGALLGSTALMPVSGESAPAGPVAGKAAGLTIHADLPTEIETPLSLLRKYQITPKEILFVRSNQQLEGCQTIAAWKDNPAGWTVTFDGLVQSPRTVTLAELKAFPSESVEMVLQCSGNGRHWFAQAHPPKAGDKLWQCGALANVRFTGVRLAEVMEHFGIKPLPEAKYVTAQGRDIPIDPKIDDFEHSLPLDDVFTRSMLVFELNGEALPAIHGGPLRLATPGYYGTMHLKWLNRLRFDATESTNYHHEGRYRTPKEPLKPGTPFKYSLTNSESNWRMKIKSIIWQPLEGETVKANSSTPIAGVAWNDGACPIDAVEVSLDRGQTWQRAKLHRPESPFAWYPWFLSVHLPKGKRQIMARAVDALGRTQPLDGTVHWNPSGYAWNGVHEVNVAAE